MSFTAQIASFSERSQRRIQEVRRGVVMKLFSSIILDTPVDTGRLRANWQISVGGPATTTLDQYDKSGSGPINQVNSVTAQTDGDVSIYLSNNLPYAWKAEFGGWNPGGDLVTSSGFSRQAPEGMVRRNVARFGRLIQIQLSQK